MPFESVRVFVGSGEASLLERKTLIYSLRKHTSRDLDIYVYNGTHNAVEPPQGEPFLAPMPLKAKYRNVTEFSNFRWIVPQLCNYQGRAIYLDSDMVCLGDIGELFDAPLGDSDFLAKPDAFGKAGWENAWGMSVTLFDCSRCRFDLEHIFSEIEQGLYAYNDFHRMTPKFLAHHAYKIGPIDPNWNVFDRYDSQTKLIHYTLMLSQPWKFPGHRYGDLWFRYFNEARKEGIITDQDVEISKLRAYVRQDILDGNKPPPAWVRKVKRKVRRLFGARA